ncbi:substrate-binding domain-containing protein [Nonomuraea sp. NPDC050663]|uniref:substrate-binding domain-containing protein n=1 Tax=Nonomuraea sp. NPDC050663 TaxID=3364370 RepID=UPI0037BB399E
MSAEERPADRRERKKAESRRAVAETALRLFAERGFDGVTIAEVAEAADVSAKTVFNYFPAKEQLFFEHEPLLAVSPPELAAGLEAGLEAGLGAGLGAGALRVADEATLRTYARIYRDSGTLQAYGRELFAAHQRELAGLLARPEGERSPQALTEGERSPRALPEGERSPRVLPAPGMLAALITAALHEAWERVLLEVAEGQAAGEAVGEGLRALEAAVAPLAGLLGGPARATKPAPSPRPEGAFEAAPGAPSAPAASRATGVAAGHRASHAQDATVGAALRGEDAAGDAAMHGAMAAEGVAKRGKEAAGSAAGYGTEAAGGAAGRGEDAAGQAAPAARRPAVPPAPAVGGQALLPARSGVSGHAAQPGLFSEGARTPRGDRPSITRVAELAGVSATTVSHTLNGRRPVAEETRRRVLQAIDELGYRPNVLARGLRTSRSQTIGLIIPDITNPFYPALARGLQDVLGPAGYDQIIGNTDGDRNLEQAAIEQMIARQVDGLAFAVFHTHAEDLLPAIEAGIPVVRLGGRLAQHGVDLVHSDDEGGAAEATRYLLSRGYRRIGFVCGAQAEGPAAERVAGYRAALREAGLLEGGETRSGESTSDEATPGEATPGAARSGAAPTGTAPTGAATSGATPSGKAPSPTGAVPGDPRRTPSDLVVYTDFSRAGGAEGVARLLDLPHPPDAVLCANDLMAIGALDTAEARGLRVPDDLAVMGFDDIEAAGLVSPGLTTMANPAREIGQASAARLLERLEGRLAEPYSEIVIPARLVRRRSA